MAAPVADTVIILKELWFYVWWFSEVLSRGLPLFHLPQNFHRARTASRLIFYKALKANILAVVA